MIVFIIVFEFFCCISYKVVKDSNESEYELKMLKACEIYVENYEPLYYFKGDTLEIGIFNTIPDSINIFFFELYASQ